MHSTLERHFAAIGARLEIRRGPAAADYTLDVVSDRQGEYFELRGSRLDDLVVQHVDKRGRHILVRGSEHHHGSKARVSRFLCGHDERHWFVAGIGEAAATVRDAKLSLAPAAIRDAVARERHRDRRRNSLFTRQGEWFFVPASLPARETRFPIHRNEPITRGRGKPHWCEELVRHGGRTVRLHMGREIGDAEFAVLIAKNSNLSYRIMTRDAEVYVRGRVRHSDHATIHLHGWHRVYLNGEATSDRVVFYD
jgi:hypothetical protein